MVPTVSYCEIATSGLIKRPYYFISNFAYLIIAIWFFRQKNKIGKTFGFLSLGVGAASAVYDLSFSYFAQQVDLFMMLLLVAVLAKFVIPEKYLKPYSVCCLPLLALSMLIIFQQRGNSGDIVFALYVLMFITANFIRFGQDLILSKFSLAFLFLLGGFSFWLMDFNRIYCVRFGLLNGRSIFHIATALALFFLYKFYSEKL